MPEISYWAPALKAQSPRLSATGFIAVFVLFRARFPSSKQPAFWRMRLPIGGEVHFEVGQVDLSLVLDRRFRIRYLFPVGPAVPARPAGRRFHFALTVNARGAVGQGVEPGHGDLHLA